MSESAKRSIENAALIIESFGGIRPMSAKIDVAVTTIQGWKKRGVIPNARKDILLKASAEHNIDLSEFFDDAPPINDSVEEVEGSDDINDDIAAIDDKIIASLKISEESDNNAPDVKIDEFASKNKIAAKNQNFTEIAMKTERRAITKSVLIAASIVLLVVITIIVMIWPDFEEFDKRGGRIAALEGEISDIKHKQSSFKGLVPENWSKQLNDLKQQVSKAKKVVDTTVSSVTHASKDLMAANGLEERVVKLQSYVSEITGNSGVYSLLGRFDAMNNSSKGQSLLDSSVVEISTMLGSIKGKDDSYINGALSAARSQNAALQQTLGDVPQNELKAAAMLLALTQVRSALNRNDAAFDNDLDLLMKMVGEDNADLKASLDKLSPHAKTGVLSAQGLQDEFRSLAGDVVAASLSGEDVSLSEKASARMNDILQLEKDGELITGTQTQAKVKKADKMMQDGNLSGAIKYLKKSLEAKELKPLRPWIKQAEAVLNSRKVKKAIEKAINLQAGSGYLGGSQLLNE